MNSISLAYVVSQIAAVVAFCFLMAHYLVKTRAKIALMHQGAMIANGISYGLLKGWSGVAMCVIALVRNQYTLIDERRHGGNDEIRRQDVVFLVVLYVAIAITAIMTYRGPGSMLSVAALAVQTYALWQKDVLRCKFLGIIVSILFVIYNIYILSVFGTLLQAVTLAVSIIGYVIAAREQEVKE